MDQTPTGNFPRDLESRFNYRLARDRVGFVMNAVRMPPRLFGEFIGQPDLFREVFTYSRPMTKMLADAISQRFPQIDPDWLLNGPKL